MSAVKLYRSYWTNFRQETITFPERWDVEVFSMEGAERQEASLQDIRSSIENPIGTPSLREISKGRRDAVIVFDDISRPTKTEEIVPFVLTELRSAGMKDENIHFVCALGAHGAHTRAEFLKKLGKGIVGNFKVYNHNPFINCDYIGTTRYGTKVSVNREVLNHDVKIGIGCILPHQITGFSGGGKLFVPGVAGIETIEQNHGVLLRKMTLRKAGNHGNRSSVFWKEDDNIIRNDIDEAVRMIGVDFMINVLVNGRGQTVEVYAGDYTKYMPRALEAAKGLYRTRPMRNKRKVVILNVLLKANEAFVASLLGRLALHEEGGTVVIVTDSYTGQTIHYLTGSFGKYSKGNLYLTSRCPKNLRQLIILTENAEKASEDWFVSPEKGIVWTDNWEAVFREIEQEYPHGVIETAVFPNASVQYYPDYEVFV